MNADHRHSELTERIIGAAYEVHKVLGAGFLEKVYEGALAAELAAGGLDVRRQEPIDVIYKGTRVGEYMADLVIEDKVIVEVKAAEDLTGAHEAQLLNYLRATGMEVGLLINFGKSVTVKRRVMSRR